MKRKTHRIKGGSFSHKNKRTRIIDRPTEKKKKCKFKR